MSTTDTTSPLHILLVEDSVGDANLTREAFRNARVANRLHVVADGEAALEFVRQDGSFEDAPRPDLLLLDLNLPRMTGHDVLAELKADPALKSIPVIVLTTSSTHADISESYRLHANSFVTKPVDLDEFFDAVESIETFWLAIVRLPPGPSSA